MQLREREQLRGIHRAHQPKPRNAQNGGAQFVLRAYLPPQLFRVAPQIPVDCRLRILRRCGRHPQAAGKPCRRHNEHDHRQQRRAVSGHRRAENLAEQNRQKRARFNQAVARQQMLFAQIFGQDGIFHRPENRGMHAHQEQTQQQHRRGRSGKTPAGQRHNRHFKHFDGARQPCFVEARGQLPGQRGKQEIRQHKQ